ncbi:putative uncharacterized protein DDB_G0286901 isoform X2 [Pseudomyrmex gracilis]|uniref:putative uncharacterized protein DDB_G0286901 isoform X2 n=1 Tax=Pseudomyrmex gracilis TaxID=219809 RepID=UPI0009958A8C|nr:putative uncharacterized protein DDB_G0286901 isoform X2 [Pseudomyrmex gracilis]
MAVQSVQCETIYTTGSGQQCRLSVQKLNAAKANFSLFSTTSNQNDSGSDSCDVHTSIPEVSGKNTVVENKENYLDSSERESLSDAENSIYENSNDTEDVMPKEKSLSNEYNNASCLNNFEDIVNDSSCESENDEAKETSDICSNYNSNISNCNFEDNNIFNMNHNTVTNIFETYSELNENDDEDMMLSKKPCINTTNDSCERKDVTCETKELSTSNEKCKLQDKNHSSKECIDVANIFETYDDLNEPLEF